LGLFFYDSIGPLNHFASIFLLDMQALSASGLRALRYAREVEGIGKVVALDNDKGISRLSGSFCLLVGFEKTHFCTKWPHE
jgi:hypothetical protein